MIEGVVLKSLETYPDERGFFREVVRASDGFFGEGFAQLSHAFMRAGVAKAWHVHDRQVDWWYVVSGCLKVALYDLRYDKPWQEFEAADVTIQHFSDTAGELMELFLGDGYPAQVLRIPPGVAHGCKALEPTHLLYVTSREYDGTDEGRLPHDVSGIDYDWLGGPEVK